MCREILAEEGIDQEIFAFSSAQELENVLEKEGNRFNCLLLDIRMEGMNGMELAQTLRARNDNVSIIFISGYEDYLREGYYVRPVHFLLKPIEYDALAEALRTDWKLNHRSKTVAFQVGNRTVHLKVEKIGYIESQNHKVIVHGKEKETSYSISMNEIERLMPNQFYRCHKSFLVNMEHVVEISRTELLMSGGEKIPIGRKYYKDFQLGFIRYMNQ